MKLSEVAARASPVFRKYGVVRAIVFGSWARETATRRSDLDLILVQETERRFFERYDGLLLELGLALPGIELDVLIYTARELEELAVRPLISTALREGKTIYECGEESP